MTSASYGSSTQSPLVVITPAAAGRAAYGLQQELRLAGWRVALIDDPAAWVSSAHACIVILSPTTVWDPQATAAMSAGFRALIPVITQPMTPPAVQWSSPPYILGQTDQQQQAAGAQIAQTLAQLPAPVAPPLAAQSYQPQPPQQTPFPTPGAPPTYAAQPGTAAPIAPVPQAPPAWGSTPAAAGAYAAPPATGQYGALHREYPGSPIRYAWFLLIALAVFGLFASFTGQTSLFGALIWLAIGAGSALYFYYRLRNIHGWIYERGFVITRGARTTQGRWEDIASVQHRVTRYRMYLFIPMGSSHNFIIKLKNGQSEQVTSAFTKEQELGTIIQQMWAQVNRAGRP